MPSGVVYVVLSWHVEIIDHYDATPHANVEYVERIQNIFSVHQAARHSLLIQADRSIEAACGDSDFIFSRWESVWKKRQSEGHEIGWHFHPIIFDGQWRQSQAFSEVEASLNQAYSRLSNLFEVESVSTGWCFASNELLQAYAERGVRVDASALPTLRCSGRRPKGYGDLGKVNIFDWTGSPDSPYWLSQADYRVAAQQATQLLEVPILTDGVLLLNLGDDPKWCKRIVHRLFAYARSSKQPVVLHGYSHSYNMSGVGFANFVEHMDSFLSIAKRNDVELRFVTLAELLHRWREFVPVYRLPRSPRALQQTLVFGEKVKHKIAGYRTSLMDMVR